MVDVMYESFANVLLVQVCIGRIVSVGESL